MGKEKERFNIDLGSKDSLKVSSGSKAAIRSSSSVDYVKKSLKDYSDFSASISQDVADTVATRMANQEGRTFKKYSSSGTRTKGGPGALDQRDSYFTSLSETYKSNVQKEMNQNTTPPREGNTTPPSKGDPIKTDPVKDVPIKLDPIKGDPIKVDPIKVDAPIKHQDEVKKVGSGDLGPAIVDKKEQNGKATIKTPLKA